MKIYIVISFPFTRNLEKDELFGSPDCNLCLEKSYISGIYADKKEAEQKRLEESADCQAPPQGRAKIYELE